MNIIRELATIIKGPLNQELRGCQPRDLVNHVCWEARYADKEPQLDRESLMTAVETYFIPQS
jgi:hypothetical protein